MVTRYRSFGEMVQSAQNAVDDCHKISFSPFFDRDSLLKLRDWLQNLLDILKVGKYATIKQKNGTSIDVARIAYTHDFASFFDVYNHVEYFDLDIMPTVTEELKNKLTYDSGTPYLNKSSK